MPEVCFAYNISAGAMCAGRFFGPFRISNLRDNSAKGGMFCQEMVKMLKNVGFERKIL